MDPRSILSCLLAIVLCIEVLQSFLKYLDGNPSSSITEVSVSEVHLPDVTICYEPEDEMKRQETLQEQYEKLISNESWSIKADFTNDHREDFGKNYQDREHLASIGYDFDQIWDLNFFFLTSKNRLAKCQTFKPPLPVNPSPYNQLSFHLPIVDNHSMTIKLHNRDNFVDNEDRFLGATTLTLDAKRDGSKVLLYEVRVKEIQNLDKKKARCNSKNDTKFRLCIKQYYDNKLPCRLPWSTKKNASVCNGGDHIKAIEGVNSEISSEKSFAKIEATVGCLRNCKYSKFEFKERGKFLSDEPDMKNKVLLRIGALQFDVQLQAERWTYDLSTFVANVGGLAGLLLGLSILDIYDRVFLSWKMLLKRIKK